MSEIRTRFSLRDKTVMITGGTGSFGHFIMPILLKNGAREVRIFSRDQHKQNRMQQEFPDERVKFVVGDVRDYYRVEEAMKNVDVIYHAAALKIIPLCEIHPSETVKTDVIGTENVKRAAGKMGADRAVLISTDKAVKPVNVYGMSKAIAERIFISNEFSSSTRFSCIRYGNVMGSRDSIIPFFSDLIKKGEPLPITNKEMTRFWITPEQASELVLFATVNAQHGRIIVSDLPACKTVTLARVMAGKNYRLKEVGIRAGEKIHECLISEEEMRRAEKRDNYFVLHPYGEYSSGTIAAEFTSDAARQMKDKEIRRLLETNGWL